jgi:hypothetical protein
MNSFMNNLLPMERYGLGSYLSECLVYFKVMIILHFCAFFVGCLVLLLLNKRSLRDSVERVIRLGLFIGLLLIVSSLFNGLWSCLIFDHFYYSTDYIVDFTPFYPVTLVAHSPKVIDIYGRPFGTTFVTINIIWFLFTLCTWGGAIFLYGVLTNRGWPLQPGRKMNSTSQPEPGK